MINNETWNLIKVDKKNYGTLYLSKKLTELLSVTLERDFFLLNTQEYIKKKKKGEEPLETTHAPK